MVPHLLPSCITDCKFSWEGNYLDSTFSSKCELLISLPCSKWATYLISFQCSLYFTSLSVLYSSDSFFIQGPANLVRDASCWRREHEWRQDIAVATKWLSGVSPVCNYIVLCWCHVQIFPVFLLMKSCKHFNLSIVYLELLWL